MDSDRHIWQTWASFLHRWGADEWIASVLEAAGPLTILGAQICYVGQPLLRQAVPDDHFEALSRVLEDTGQMQAFINYLREASSSGAV